MTTKPRQPLSGYIRSYQAGLVSTELIERFERWAAGAEAMENRIAELCPTIVRADQEAPLRWYYAAHVADERWEYGGDSREEAIAEGLACYAAETGSGEDCDGVAIAHEQTGVDFWAAVASSIAGNLDQTDENIAEDSLIDPEDAWLETVKTKKGGAMPAGLTLERALEAWLPTVIARPGWRAIEDPEWVDGPTWRAREENDGQASSPATETEPQTRTAGSTAGKE